MLRQLSHAEWQELTQKVSALPFSQSAEWGVVQEAAGFPVYRFADKETGALAQVIEHALPLGLKRWVITHGPMKANTEFVQAIAKEAKKHGAYELKFEPDTQVPGAKKTHAMSPEVTWVTDLTESIEDILTKSHCKTRYNVRVSQKRGVKVEESQDVKAFLELMKETTARQGFSAHPDSYYRAILQSPLAKLWIARREGIALAGMIAIYFRDTVTYLHGGSSGLMRESMAAQGLHFHVLTHAKEAGYKKYDWWGVNPADEKHPAYKASWVGITRFKKCFHGQEIITPGTWSISLNPFVSTLMEIRAKLRK